MGKVHGVRGGDGKAEDGRVWEGRGDLGVG